MTRDTQPAAEPRRRRRAWAAAAAVSGCALVLAAGAPAVAHGSHGGHERQYVALGDSYTSGPLIPTQVDANCARSDHNLS
ncbi:SGNH/GDSL hydrolase family protein, partial [Streptomyces sp. NPDC057403]